MGPPHFPVPRKDMAPPHFLVALGVERCERPSWMLRRPRTGLVSDFLAVPAETEGLDVMASGKDWPAFEPQRICSAVVSH